MPSKSSEALRRRVVAEARRFDGPSLLAALDGLGYGPERVVFKSRHGKSRPTSLIHAVELADAPERRAIVTVNLGLLGSESPLPSYLHQLIDRAPDRLVPFFEFLDHALVGARLRSLEPERDRAIVSDWDAALRSLSRLARLDTPMGAHWLFRRVYPELEVAVRRAARRWRVETAAVTVGRSRLDGGSTLGSGADALTGGLAVTLTAGDPQASDGRPWQDEAAARLRERLLPLVPPSRAVWSVTLVIRERPNQLRLAAGHYLGLQTLEGGGAAARVLLHDGPIG